MTRERVAENVPADPAQAGSLARTPQRPLDLAAVHHHAVHPTEHERPAKVPMLLEGIEHFITERDLATQTGGNGLTGHDETSENTGVTWDSAFTAPTPGVVPPGL